MSVSMTASGLVLIFTAAFAQNVGAWEGRWVNEKRQTMTISSFGDDIEILGPGASVDWFVPPNETLTWDFGMVCSKRKLSPDGTKLRVVTEGCNNQGFNGKVAICTVSSESLRCTGPFGERVWTKQ